MYLTKPGQICPLSADEGTTDGKADQSIHYLCFPAFGYSSNCGCPAGRHKLRSLNNRPAGSTQPVGRQVRDRPAGSTEPVGRQIRDRPATRSRSMGRGTGDRPATRSRSMGRRTGDRPAACSRSVGRPVSNRFFKRAWRQYSRQARFTAPDRPSRSTALLLRSKPNLTAHTPPAKCLCTVHFARARQADILEGFVAPSSKG